MVSLMLFVVGFCMGAHGEVSPPSQAVLRAAGPGPVVPGRPQESGADPEGQATADQRGQPAKKPKGSPAPDQDSQPEPLRTDAVIKELTRMDRNGDGAVGYLEARDLGSVDLVTFRRIDTDSSGGLDLLEFETYMVQTYRNNGLPVERSLELRVQAHVEELAKQHEEEAARQRPTYLLERTLEALMDDSQIASSRPITTTRLYHRLLPDRPRPRSPYHPRYHGF